VGGFQVEEKRIQSLKKKAHKISMKGRAKKDFVTIWVGMWA